MRRVASDAPSLCITGLLNTSAPEENHKLIMELQGQVVLVGLKAREGAFPKLHRQVLVSVIC